MRKLGIMVIAAGALLITGLIPAYSEAPLDTAALSGLNEVKVAFDMQTGNSAALLKQLEVIEETRESLIKQGIKPSFVITFRGPATKLVQTDPSQIAAEDRANASTIARKIRALKGAEGVSSTNSAPLLCGWLGRNRRTCFPRSRLWGTVGSRLWRTKQKATDTSHRSPRGCAAAPLQNCIEAGLHLPPLLLVGAIEPLPQRGLSQSFSGHDFKGVALC